MDIEVGKTYKYIGKLSDCIGNNICVKEIINSSYIIGKTVDKYGEEITGKDKIINKSNLEPINNLSVELV